MDTFFNSPTFIHVAVIAGVAVLVLLVWLRRRNKRAEAATAKALQFSACVPKRPHAKEMLGALREAAQKGTTVTFREYEGNTAFIYVVPPGNPRETKATLSVEIQPMQGMPAESRITVFSESGGSIYSTVKSGEFERAVQHALRLMAEAGAIHGALAPFLKAV
jgi:hypothetical protein